MKSFSTRAILRFGFGALALSAPLASPAFAQQSDDATADEVVVVGYRAQLEQAIADKRDETRIADFLSADDIGAQPDYNISDALRRLPGIQTLFDEDEGRYVSVRGLNPSYTLGAFDGSTLATAERQNRQLNMESIPSGAVKKVAVYKSRTPDSDGNAIGGTLDLISRSAFDTEGLYAAGSFLVGYSDSDAVPGEGFGRDTDDGLNYRFDGTVSTTFGANNMFGVLVGINFMERNRDQERLLPQAGVAGATSTPTPVTSGTQTDLLWSNYPNTITRYGGILKLEFEPSDAFHADFAVQYYRQDDNELRHSVRLRNGTGNNATFIRFNDFPLEKPLTVVSSHVTWDINDDNEIKLRGAYSEAQFLEPSNQVQFNLTGAAASFDLSQTAGGVPIATNVDPRVSNPANYTLSSFAPYQDDSDEYVKEFALDYGFNTGRGDTGLGFGAGVKWREINRNNDSTNFRYTYTGATPLSLSGFTLNTNYTPIYGTFEQIYIDFQKFQDYVGANPNLFTLNVDQSRGSDWDFVEQVGAIYGLVRHKGDRHTVIFGGRFEDTSTEVERQRTAGALVERVTREGSYDHFLPSITLDYKLSDDLRFRAAAFSAIGRPNPSQLASAETVNQTTGAISRGNPDLVAREGNSYEAAFEYYLPGNAGLFSFGLFHKSVDNEIVQRLTVGAGPNGEDVTQPVNVTSAKVTGIELAATLNNLPLPSFLHNFGVSANATFLNGRFDTGGSRGFVNNLQGQSDTLFNMALFYEQGPFRARASYAFIDDAFTNISATSAGADRFDKATNTVDAQARYTIVDGVELIAEVRNVTDEDKVNYTADGLYRDVSLYGRQFWFGTSVKF